MIRVNLDHAAVDWQKAEGWSSSGSRPESCPRGGPIYDISGNLTRSPCLQGRPVNEGSENPKPCCFVRDRDCDSAVNPSISCNSRVSEAAEVSENSNSDNCMLNACNVHAVGNTSVERYDTDSCNMVHCQQQAVSSTKNTYICI